MEWTTVIGLEVHVELNTKSKIFCSCTTEFGGEPNTHCCPICLGLPGTLPVLNKKVCEYAIKSALALNCQINRYNRFDRKNYFYPDLPKAYQISQLYVPFSFDGSLEINTEDGLLKNIRIHEIHMEEDAGKLIHSENETYPDYNRAGVPLIEIVTEPDFRSADEVIAFLEMLKTTFQYLKVSDCKIQEGSMRVDVNLSVMSKDSKVNGTRTEMKNIGSFKSIRRAIEYESKRQIEIIESGGVVKQETRRFDEDKGISVSMRSKENANDYRYFPEPDIPPLEFSIGFIENLRSQLPELPAKKLQRYISELEIPKSEAVIITSSIELVDLFEQTVNLCGNPNEVSRWIVNNVMNLINESKVTLNQTLFTPEKFSDFIKTIQKGNITQQTAKEVFKLLFFAKDDFDIETYIKEKGLYMLDDFGIIREIVKDIIIKNPKPIEQYKGGQTKVFGYFVGQVMKATNGKANPEVVNKIVGEELAKL